jgi:membrane-associated phospholipid phosphatase
MGFGILASLSRSPAWQISCIIMAASAGYSRMYLGQHYLHDVIGGACISLIWLIFFIRLKLKFRSALMQNEQ